MATYKEKFRYEIEVDQEQIDEALQLLNDVGGNSTQALVRGINRAGPKIRTLTSAKIRENVRLTAKYITGTTGADGGKRQPRLNFVKASFARPTGRITTPYRGVLSSRYSTDPQLKNSWEKKWDAAPPVPDTGISLQIKAKGGAAQLSNEWFYMVFKNSRQIGIVKWETPERKKWRDLTVGLAPSLSQVMNQIKDEKITPTANRYLYEEVLNQIETLIKGETGIK